MAIKIVEETVDKSCRFYTVTIGNEEIWTVVTSSPSKVKRWIEVIERINSCRLDRLIVGLDIEWRPYFESWDENPVATLQLCVGNFCLIFQILHAPSIPELLRDFLRNPNYIFVGVGIKSDVKRLLDDYSLAVSKTRDLRTWAAKELHRKELGKVGLKHLVGEVVGIEFEKQKNVTLSNWGNAVLTKPQVSYACLDAYLSFQIGRRLSPWY